MEFILLSCWSCDAIFYTASERSTHHLLAHERLMRADGTLLVVPDALPAASTENGMVPAEAEAQP